MDAKLTLGAIAAAIGLGYVLFDPLSGMKLPSGAIDLGTGRAIGALPDRPEDATPSDMIAFTSRQWGTKAHVAISAGLTPVWIEQVLTGYEHGVPQEPVLFGDYIPLKSGCALDQVPDAEVVSLIAGESGREMALMGTDARNLYSAVDGLIERYSETGNDEVYSASNPDFYVVDVVVPPSDQPLHLTLLNTRENLMWNFHIADGVQIKGVTLLGGRTQGVANLPDDVFVQAMDDEALADCDIKAWVQRYEGPDDNAAFGIDPEALATAQSERPDAFRTWGMEFEDWYIGQIGQNPRDGIIGYSDVQVLVAGDAARMTAPVQWTSPSANPVRLIERQMYITGGPAGRAQQWRDTVRQLAERKIGVPLETLHPDRQEENG